MAWDAYFGGIASRLPHEAIAAIICREFGWTFDEYLDQPKYFIETVADMLAAENRAIETQARRNRS